MQKTSNVLLSLSILLGLIALSLGIVRGLDTFKQKDRYVTVRGLSEKLVTANFAQLNLNLTSTNADQSKIIQKLTEDSKLTSDYLKQYGIEENEINISPISIQKDYNPAGQPQTFTGRTNIQVASTAIDKINEAYFKINNLLTKGIMIEGHQLRFKYTNLNDIKDEMIKDATIKAKKSADVFAKDSQTKVGNIKSARQGLFSITSPFESFDDPKSKEKKVRVVITMEYYLEN